MSIGAENISEILMFSGNPSVFILHLLKLCELRVYPLRSYRLGSNAFNAEYAEIKTQSAHREED